jgi:hypothetical protein
MTQEEFNHFIDLHIVGTWRDNCFLKRPTKEVQEMIDEGIERFETRFNMRYIEPKNRELNND